MKRSFFNISKSFARQISVDNYCRITGRKQILPFYHTVFREKKPHFSNIGYSRSYSRFVEDLDFLTANFENIPVEKIGEGSAGFHLTFDDGMSEIYHVIAPLLLERKLDATFFITADFLDNKTMFRSHKISLILSEMNNSAHNRTKVAGFLNCSENQIEKEIYSQKNKTDEIADLIQLSFKDYLQEEKPYCSTAQIIELKKMGFNIGNHSRTHRNFNTLNFEQQKEEIVSVNRFLKELGTKELYFCFPYGDHQIKNELFEWMYQEGGISKSFGISGIKPDDFPKHHHRVLMEYEELSGEEIITSEYLLFAIKSLVRQNRVSR